MTPGRIDLNSSSLPGIYVESFGEQFDNETTFYLLNHEELHWVNFTFKNGAAFPNNSVTLQNPGIHFGIGRHNESDFVNVGKATEEFGFYYALNGKFVKKNNFELLCCKTFDIPSFSFNTTE